MLQQDLCHGLTAVGNSVSFTGLLGLNTAQRRCQYCAGHRAETDRGAFFVA